MDQDDNHILDFNSTYAHLPAGILSNTFGLDFLRNRVGYFVNHNYWELTWKDEDVKVFLEEYVDSESIPGAISAPTMLFTRQGTLLVYLV